MVLSLEQISVVKISKTQEFIFLRKNILNQRKLPFHFQQ